MKSREEIEKRLEKINKLVKRCEKHYAKYWSLLQITDHTIKGFIFKGHKTWHYVRKRKNLTIEYNRLLDYKKQIEWVLSD